MSTLPPFPTFNANIPIISSAGGTAVAYKDPKSPESIMKKTTLLQAQTTVDTAYDVDLNKVKEEFRGFSGKGIRGGKSILYFFVFLLVIALFTQKKRFGKIYIAFLVTVLLVIAIFLLNGRDFSY
jgi:hypothetical protein